MSAVVDGRGAVLSNGLVEVRYAGNGTWSAARGGVVFCSGASSVAAGGPKTRPRLTASPFRDRPGRGWQLEVEWSASGPIARTERIALYEGSPLVHLRVALRNRSGESRKIDRVSYLRASLPAAGPAMRFLTHEGPVRLTEEWQSTYCSFAWAGARSRRGIVGGYVTNERAMTRFALARHEEGARLEAYGLYGGVLVPARGELVSERFVLGLFNDALEGLEQYAEVCARLQGVCLPPQQWDGYCTWYHARAGSQDDLARAAEFIGRELRDYGLNLVQIDDGWQVGGRNYVAASPTGPYSRGMKSMADAIKATGATPGIWLTPFGWGEPGYASDRWGEVTPPELEGHPELFMREQDGTVFSSGWGGQALDYTNPRTRRFLHRVISRIVKEWGYPYLKLDATYTGIGSHLDDDELRDLVLHDKTKTNIESYREGLKTVRSAAGEEAFLLGCNVIQHMATLGPSIGLVDGMRIGTDVLGGPSLVARWERMLPCAKHAAWRYFWHGRAWYNDPDCLIVRPPLTVAQARAWASLMAVSGQMILVSEDLPALPADRLEIVKRVLPSYGLCGRPLDLFACELPRKWLLDVRRGSSSWKVLGLFNWDGREAQAITVTAAEMGLDRRKRYVLFENWTGRLVGVMEGRHTVKLPRSSCQVLTVREMADQPMALGSTRHALGGAVEIGEAVWEPQTLTLAGQFAAVRGRADTISIYVPEGLAPAEARVNGVEVGDATKERGRLLCVPVGAARTERVAWSVRFAPVHETKKGRRR